jgi:DNA-binding transcriptional ArsR family regulator
MTESPSNGQSSIQARLPGQDEVSQPSINRATDSFGSTPAGQSAQTSFARAVVPSTPDGPSTTAGRPQLLEPAQPIEYDPTMSDDVDAVIAGVGFNPALHTWLEPRQLRGIAHPLRVQLLKLLREEGPSTATKLAEKLGLTSGATSYHLRQLAKHDFIEETEGPRKMGRERWWQARSESSYFDQHEDSDPSRKQLSEKYLRAVAELYAQRMEEWVARFPSWGPDWADASTLSDVSVVLTPDQAKRLIQSIWDVVDQIRNEDAQSPTDDQQRVTVQFQVFPRFDDDDASRTAGSAALPPPRKRRQTSRRGARR